MVDPKIMGICQKQLGQFNGEIVSTSLEPITFGRNICLPNLNGSYYSMLVRILVALENSTADIVFFTEDDVLYHPSHFDFTPVRDDIYYYDINNWRWDYPNDRLINYEGLSSLSLMCCHRKLALAHYKEKVRRAYEQPNFNALGEPSWARIWGYEPGTKPTRKGGFSNEEHEKWTAPFPSIDIRHERTFTMSKTHLSEFKHPPKLETWKEVKLSEIPGWNLKEMFA